MSDMCSLGFSFVDQQNRANKFVEIKCTCTEPTNYKHVASYLTNQILVNTFGTQIFSRAWRKSVFPRLEPLVYFAFC